MISPFHLNPYRFVGSIMLNPRVAQPTTRVHWCHWRSPCRQCTRVDLAPPCRSSWKEPSSQATSWCSQSWQSRLNLWHGSSRQSATSCRDRLETKQMSMMSMVFWSSGFLQLLCTTLAEHHLSSAIAAVAADCSIRCLEVWFLCRHHLVSRGKAATP